MLDKIFTTYLTNETVREMAESGLRKEAYGNGQVLAAIIEEQSASTEEILAASENLYEQSQSIAGNSHEAENMAVALADTAVVLLLRDRCSSLRHKLHIFRYIALSEPH